MKGQLYLLAIAAGVAVCWCLSEPRPNGATPLPPSSRSADDDDARRLPWRKPRTRTPIESIRPGQFLPNGPICPADGATEVTCDLPPSLRMHNTGGMGKQGPGTGAGLCVFTSVEHAARYQNEPRLFGFQQKMTREPGGGDPEKLDRMIHKYAPGVDYVQHTRGDAEFLRQALKTGRMVSVTYAGRDDFYRGMIYHMVSLIHLDDATACILDNNREKVYVWMSAGDFLNRWRDANGGWAVVLNAPAPPPPPKN